MRTTALAWTLSAMLALALAAPAPEPAPVAAAADDSTPEVIEIIAPAASAQETLATLNLGAAGGGTELSERNKRTIGILRQLFPALAQGANAEAGDADTAQGEERQLLSGAESQQAEVRVAFGDDQQAAAQTNNAAIDEITLDDGDGSEENRNKRFLNFGVGAEASAGGGGSGNFIFDIVRRPAEAMARAAGSAFRLFAGTDSLNVGLTASHTATRDAADAQLVAGSSSGGGGAGAEVGVDGTDDAGAAKGDGLTEGVPGPITRLFIIANRGIANLIQDLILRLAQTSERIVNFKARLITSII